MWHHIFAARTPEQDNKARNSAVSSAADHQIKAQTVEDKLVPGSRIQFLDKPNGANGSGTAAEAGNEAPVSGPDSPAADAPSQAGDTGTDGIPF